ncbi:YgiT-type zinc finger protein [bacterium]|nr:YgiT-type zinc finger protein [bacterium]
MRRDWVDEFQGQTYVVPDLEYHECPDCGERVYDPQAMRKIEAHSPAYAKTRAQKKTPLQLRRHFSTMIEISICPTCGSNKVKRVKRDWTDQFNGEVYTVPNLEFHECPACGEMIYDPQAMRKIEAYSPAYTKRQKRRKAA